MAIFSNFYLKRYFNDELIFKIVVVIHLLINQLIVAALLIVVIN